MTYKRVRCDKGSCSRADLEAQVAKFRKALESIARCEQHYHGDVVWVARSALGLTGPYTASDQAAAERAKS